MFATKKIVSRDLPSDEAKEMKDKLKNYEGVHKIQLTPCGSRKPYSKKLTVFYYDDKGLDTLYFLRDFRNLGLKQS